MHALHALCPVLLPHGIQLWVVHDVFLSVNGPAAAMGAVYLHSCTTYMYKTWVNALAAYIGRQLAQACSVSKTDGESSRPHCSHFHGIVVVAG